MLDSLFTPIDNYCERLGPEFWAEPLNAVTNAGFIVATLLMWRLVRARGQGFTLQSGILTAMMAVIGVGSFLFHTLAVRWAMLADVIPIALYQLLFLVFYTHTVIGQSVARVTVWVLLFLGMGYGFDAMPRHWLNGSLGYVPALIFVVVMGLYHWRSRKQEPLVLLASAGIFALALTFRSLDLQLCESLQIGTHFVWHLLNSVVIYLATRAFVVNLPAPSISSPRRQDQRHFTATMDTEGSK